MSNIPRKLLLFAVIIQTVFKCASLKHLEPQTAAEDRMIKPPRFPYWGPFGWFSSALLCPFFAGPEPGMQPRACLGPTTPFKNKNTTTTTPAPPQIIPISTTNEPDKVDYDHENYYVDGEDMEDEYEDVIYYRY